MVPECGGGEDGGDCDDNGEPGTEDDGEGESHDDGENGADEEESPADGTWDAPRTRSRRGLRRGSEPFTATN